MGAGRPAPWGTNEGPARRAGGPGGGGGGAWARWTWAAVGHGRCLRTPWAGPGGKCVGEGGGMDGRHPAGPAPAATKFESMNNLHPNLVLTAKY